MRDPATRAMGSLEGLSVGDGLGQRFFCREIAAQHGPNHEPPPPWWWTDDTNMALSILEVLMDRGTIDQDALAASFVARFDPGRQYGPKMVRLIPELGRRHWSVVAPLVAGGAGSWGNGAAMRVAPLGAFFADDLDSCVREARRQAAVTHSHEEAQAGAIAVALTAAVVVELDSDVTFVDAIGRVIDRTPTSSVRTGLCTAQELGMTYPATKAASRLGNGSRVSAQDTVPFAIWCALTRLGDYPAAVWTAIQAGGDMDTLAAIVGGIVAARQGVEGIPPEWLTAREPLPVLNTH